MYSVLPSHADPLHYNMGIGGIRLYPLLQADHAGSFYIGNRGYSDLSLSY